MEKTGKIFWTSRGNWPDDAYGYVFLGRAVHLLGQAMFPGEWTGNEPIAEPVHSFWRELHGIALPLQRLNVSERSTIHRLLAKHRPEFGRSYTIHHGPFGPEIPEFSNDELKAAIEAAQSENEERRPPLTRRAAVYRTIKEAIRDGELTMALLPKHGGRFKTDCDPAWWNTKTISPRFYLCQMDPFDPFGNGIAGDRYMHIFVSGEELSRLLPAKKTTAGGQTQFKNWFREVLTNSPDVRTMSKEEVIAKGVNEFNLSRNHASELRNEVLSEFSDEVQAVWKKAGAPKVKYEASE